MRPLASSPVRTAAGVVHGQRDRRQRRDHRARGARLRPDRRRGAHGGAVHRRQVPPCVPRAVPDREARPARRPPHAAVALRRSRRSCSSALAVDRGGQSSSWPRCSSSPSSTARIAVTARGLTRGAIASILQPAHLLREGNALLNIGFAVAAVGGSALAGLLISELGLARRAARRRRVVPRDRRRARAHAGPARRRRPSASAGWSGCASGLAFARQQPAGAAAARRPVARADPLHADHPDRGDLCEGEPRDHERRLRPPARLLGRRIVAREPASTSWCAIARRRDLILLSTAAIGLAYLGMAGAQSLLVACLLSVLGGTGNGVQWVSVMTRCRRRRPPDYQARVVGLLESSLAAMPGVGYLIGGALTAVGSPRTAYAVAGVGTLVLVLVAMVVLRQMRLDRPRRRHEDRSTQPASCSTAPPTRSGSPSTRASAELDAARPRRPHRLRPRALRRVLRRALRPHAAGARRRASADPRGRARVAAGALDRRAGRRGPSPDQPLRLPPVQPRRGPRGARAVPGGGRGRSWSGRTTARRGCRSRTPTATASRSTPSRTIHEPLNSAARPRRRPAAPSGGA